MTPHEHEIIDWIEEYNMLKSIINNVNTDLGHRLTRRCNTLCACIAAEIAKGNGKLEIDMAGSGRPIPRILWQTKHYVDGSCSKVWILS